MESQCDYSMYFPAVPFPPREFLAGESSGYRSLPRRNHLYLGETVRFLLVLRKNPGSSDRNSGNSERNSGSSDRNSGNAERNAGNADRNAGNEIPGNSSGNSEEPPLFRECRALLTHSRGAPGPAGLPVDDPIVSQDEVIFPLTVALDRLPPGTAKAKVGTFGDSLGTFGDTWGQSGESWGQPGENLGTIWGHLGTI
uniref:TRAPP14 N-terminal domain-containing protein n=1 Tax=Catharus ustulatus TaxID=91951 RepID=A0A8C3Y573_CATUS